MLTLYLKLVQSGTYITNDKFRTAPSQKLVPAQFRIEIEEMLNLNM